MSNNSDFLKRETPQQREKRINRLRRIKNAAEQLANLHVPYEYGGGHQNPVPVYPRSIDCSASVCYVFQQAGYKHFDTTDSGRLQTLPQRKKNFFYGKGLHVTIWTNPNHAFLEIDGKFLSTSNAHINGGPDWDNNRSTEGFTAIHPKYQ